MQSEPVMLTRSVPRARIARDFMQAGLITASPDTPLLDIHRMFVEEEIHGAPVVDDVGAVQGVVSTLDLIRAVRDGVDACGGYFYADAPYIGGNSVSPDEDVMKRLADSTAADVMSRELVAVAPNAPLEEVAQMMRDQRVHRVLVIDNGELIGVITTFDLLRAFIREPLRSGEPIDYDPSA